jgi:hypothetical protein
MGTLRIASVLRGAVKRPLAVDLSSLVCNGIRSLLTFRVFPHSVVYFLATTCISCNEWHRPPDMLTLIDDLFHLGTSLTVESTD